MINTPPGLLTLEGARGIASLDVARVLDLVERVMRRAKNQGHEGDFREWLLEQDLQVRTRSKVVDWGGGSETPVVEPTKKAYSKDKETAPSPKEESHADTTTSRQPETDDQDLAGDLPTEGLQPDEESGDTGGITGL